MDCFVTNRNMTLFYIIMLWLVIAEGKYEPKWNSLDSRPLPRWYDNAKVGIFIHWGVFSVPSFGSEWFWKHWSDKEQPDTQFMTKNYPESYTYQEFAKDFKAEFFNATQWAELFVKSGAKYVVLTSKHHEGYTMWPSKYSYSWNSQDIGPKRDIVGELGEAVKKQSLIYGLYHSLYEWFNPLYLFDKSTNLTTQEFVLKKVIPEMHELVEKYEPAILWSDGDWEAPDTYWKSTEFLAWLYNESPVRNIVVTNDRWGRDISCKHGDFYICKDRYNPGSLQKHKWENAMTIDKQSWGFRRNANLSDYCNITELLYQLVSTVSCGGNILINIGPTKDGIIAPIFEERLLQLGEWLSLNGEAIYATTPWKSQNDTFAKDVWYTSKGSVVYAIVLNWHDNLMLADSVKLFEDSRVMVTLLGNEQDGPLKWTVDNKRVNIAFPSKSKILSQWAYVLKIYSDFVKC